MARNHLKLNGGKTELLCFQPVKVAPCDYTQLLVPSLCPTANNQLVIKTNAKSLGFTFDSHLSLEPQIASVCAVGNYVIQVLKKTIPYIPVRLRAVVLGTLINSRLNYVNLGPIFGLGKI